MMGLSECKIKKMKWLVHPKKEKENKKTSKKAKAKIYPYAPLRGCFYSKQKIVKLRKWY
jgi:hypothetical protein